MATQVQIQAYFNNCLPLAQNAGSRFNIDPYIILAQGALESGWGTSTSCRVRKNYFGLSIGSGKPNEFWDGKGERTDKATITFRLYKTPQDSFLDFARLITNNYKQAYAVATDYKKYAHAIAYSPYIYAGNGDNPTDYERNVIWAYERLKQMKVTAPSAFANSEKKN